MTIQFFHHGNTIGEVTLDSYTTEEDARIFAASAQRVPVRHVLDAADEEGYDTILFNPNDADRQVTAWRLVDTASGIDLT